MRPGGACRHELIEGLEHGVTTFAIQLTEDLDLLPPGLRREVVRHGELGVVGWAQHGRLSGEDELFANAVGSDSPTDAEPGCDRLGEGAEVDDLLIVIGTDRPRRGSLKAEEAVGVVLEEQHPLALGDGEDVLAALRPLRHSGGVVERRDRVDHLDPFAVCARRGDGCVECGGHEAFSVHGHVHDVALVGAEDSECTDVRRGFDEDNVTRITEDAGHQIQGHLRSGRDDDVIRMRGDAHLAHDIQNLLPQGDVTLAGSVLQNLRAALSDETRRRLGEDVEWKCLDVGHAPGEGDNLRTRCDGEERADFGGGHTARAGGVGVHPGV